MPLPHTVPHAPQLVALDSRSASHPLAALLSQLAKFALHDAIWQAPHAPPLQVCVPAPLAIVHARVSSAQAPLSTW